MRSCRKNKRKMYYALLLGEEPSYDAEWHDAGDPVKRYSAPVMFMANISSGRGNAYAQPFGLLLDYSRTISTTDRLPITEGALVWTDTEPPDGEGDGATADYYVAGVSRALNSTLYALKAVAKDG